MSRFCDECDVSLDLHDGPDSCDYAEVRATAIEAVDRLFGYGVSR